MEASHFNFLEALGSDLTLAIVYRRCVKVCSLTECVFLDAADDDAKHLTLHLTSWIDGKRLPNMIATGLPSSQTVLTACSHSWS